MDTVLEALTTQIDDDIRRLGRIEPGSVEETAVANRLARNYKLRLEHLQMMQERDLEKLKIENEKTVQRRHEVLEWAGLGVKIAGGIGSGGLLIFWALKSFHFEEHGTICSKTGRDICNKLMKFLKI